MTAVIRQILLAAIIVSLVACRQQQLSSSDVILALDISDTVVGETTVRVTVRDKEGKPVDKPGAITLRGDMNHAGMAPVFRESDEAVDGLFSLPFEWTMAGEWIVEASLTLPSGDVAVQTFNYAIKPPADAGGMSDMAQGEMAIGGESSAVYMRIENEGDAPIIIAEAKTAAAGLVEFHQTVVGNDIARMEAVDGLFIGVGETLDLQSGGLHIMLMGLTEDLLPGEQFNLRLMTKDGDSIELSVPIMTMFMEGDGQEDDIGDIVISKLWARPAKAGAMDMEEDEASE